MKRVFFGWWVVLATSLINFWGAGTFFYSFTAFFNPIVNEFGWSYAATSLAASLRSLEGGIAAPLVGFAVDRYGARRFIFIGSIISGFGFVLFSRINSLWSFYSVFIFLSIGSSLMFPVPGWSAVANWFIRKRGIAFGLISSFAGLGGMLVYLVNWLIGLYGWRATLIIIGIVMWLMGIPCSLFVRHRPEPYGMFPDGDKSSLPVLNNPGSLSDEEIAYAEDFSISQAIKTRAFWIIALTITVSSASLHIVVVHIMPYLISINFDRESASFAASLVVVVSITGRFGFGWLSNQVNNRYLLAFGLLLQASGLLFLANARDLWGAILFAILFGIGYGGVLTVRLTLQAEYFGRRAFGAIQGTFMAIMLVGTFMGPFMVGMVYDLYGTYRSAWFFVIAVVVAIIPLPLGAYPPRKGER